jgi:hypothetical protein
MEDAISRKERLKALKDAAAIVDKDIENTSAEQTTGPALKFRNYAVKDEKRIEHEKVG